MMRAVSTFGTGYKPPTYHALRGPLLQTAKVKVESSLDLWRNEGKRVTGFVLSSDGWEDVTGKPLINILLSTPKGPHFVEAVNASGGNTNPLSHLTLLAGNADHRLACVSAAMLTVFLACDNSPSLFLCCQVRPRMRHS